jgi:hypothetical protein
MSDSRKRAIVLLSIVIIVVFFLIALVVGSSIPNYDGSTSSGDNIEFVSDIASGSEQFVGDFYTFSYNQSTWVKNAENNGFDVQLGNNNSGGVLSVYSDSTADDMTFEEKQELEVNSLSNIADEFELTESKEVNIGGSRTYKIVYRMKAFGSEEFSYQIRYLVSIDRKLVKFVYVYNESETEAVAVLETLINTVSSN